MSDLKVKIFKTVVIVFIGNVITVLSIFMLSFIFVMCVVFLS